jgi:hypothetical protein
MTYMSNTAPYDPDNVIVLQTGSVFPAAQQPAYITLPPQPMMMMLASSGQEMFVMPYKEPSLYQPYYMPTPQAVYFPAPAPAPAVQIASEVVFPSISPMAQSIGSLDRMPMTTSTQSTAVTTATAIIESSGSLSSHSSKSSSETKLKSTSTTTLNSSSGGPQKTITKRQSGACVECHRNKTRCDFQRPCQRCTKKGFASSCCDRAPEQKKPHRKLVSRACVCCIKAKTACDREKPCKRCKKMDLECIERPASAGAKKEASISMI